VIFFLLTACPVKHGDTVELVAAAAPVERAPPPPTGSEHDGVWTDARYDIAVRLPDGWEVITGLEGENPRLTLVDPVTRARVELSVREGGGIGPVARRGCTWHFTDTAGYRALVAPLPVRTATCTPDDPHHARVLGYYTTGAGDSASVAYDVEAVLPTGRLIDGKSAADRAIGGVRIR
jgi:hypothetical protein